MAATTIGTSGLTWGASTETYGLIQSFSETKNIEKSEVRNNAGEITALAYYNPTTAYSLSVAVTGSATVTVGGALAALANASGAIGTCRIDSITLNKSNSSFVTLDISATGYPNVT